MGAIRGEHGRVGPLLVLLVLALLLVAGQEWWLKRQREAPEKVPLPAASPRSRPSQTAAPPIPSHGGQARSTQPGDLPASPHVQALEAILRLIQQEHESEAQAKLVALPPEALSDQRIRNFAAILWNNLGVIQGKARGTAAALPAFKTAVSLNPDDPTARLNLTHAYWELKDPGLTREFLEKTIGMVPNDPLPHLALADLLYDKDDLAGAILHLDHATRHAAQNPDLRAYLELVAAKVTRTEQAEQKFVSRESSHFTVKFDGGEDYAIWHRVLDILEDAYRDIGQRFGYFPSKPVVVALHTRETFQTASGSPVWADGLFDPILGRIKIPTKGALTDEAWLTRVLRHEFVHALLHERTGGQLGAVPTWLNEGLAMQLAGDPWPDLDRIIQGDVQLMALNVLEGSWMGMPANVATVAYLEGNSATLYLIDRYGMEKVREIIGLLATGQPIAAAIHDRLFISYDEFQRRWADNLNEKLRTGKT
ncbi:MAG: hypothetical protein HY581_01420 [Nitrospirae bacterium]|nr:hypothetical protein [Nitrospirota bacterium]